MRPRQKLASQKAFKRKPKSGESAVTSPYDALQRWWMCQLISGLRRFQVFLSEESTESVLVRHFVGVKPIEGRLSRDKVERKVRVVLGRMAAQRLEHCGPLGRNVKRIATLAALSQLDAEILGFAVLLVVEEPLRNLLQDVDACSKERAYELISVALGERAEHVKTAFSSSGMLAQSELLKLEPETQNAVCKFKLMDGLAEWLVEEHVSDTSLFKHFFTEAPPAKLEVDSFPHLREDFQLSACYLRAAIRNHEPGANILLHGVPGAGKTQFARLLAKELGASLYQVAASDQGFPGGARLGSYAMCQRFLANRDDPCVIAFDEVEDVFPIEWERDSKRAGKARLNELLESNRVPAIWISNAVAHIDEAHLRRFDYSIAFPVLPREVRRRVLEKMLKERDDGAHLMAALDAEEAMTPSLAVRALRVVDAAIGTSLDSPAVVKRVVSQWKTVRGQPQRRLPPAARPLSDLRTSAHTDWSVDALARVVASPTPGAMLFHGPSGTGKTALAHALAAAANKRLIEKRPSDLLGAFVGENEANIAAAFAEAESVGGVLFLDEVDALLAARSTAGQRWEISLVSELLMGIEQFKGTLICATNFLDALDPAVLRRFAFKVRFQYLDMERAERLLRQTFEGLGVSMGADEAVARLRTLPPLAVGDFAAATRRAIALESIENGVEFVGFLAAEATLRSRASGIGFTQKL